MVSFFKVYRERKVDSALISFHEVINVQSFDVCDVTPAGVHNISPCFVNVFLLILRRTKLLHSFKVSLTIFHQLMKLRSLDLLKRVST